jgi:hypothetical protein
MGMGSVNASMLPMDDSCNPVYPHDFLQCVPSSIQACQCRIKVNATWTWMCSMDCMAFQAINKGKLVSVVIPQLRVNTIFNVAKDSGLLTAWVDKHPAYDLLQGATDQLHVTSPIFVHVGCQGIVLLET